MAPAAQQAGNSFLKAQATTTSLHFPSSLSTAAREFIRGALAENPGDRTTARELLRHPWLASVRAKAAAVAAAAAAPGGASVVKAAVGSLAASVPAAATEAAATPMYMAGISF